MLRDTSFDGAGDPGNDEAANNGDVEGAVPCLSDDVTVDEPLFTELACSEA